MGQWAQEVVAVGWGPRGGDDGQVRGRDGRKRKNVPTTADHTALLDGWRRADGVPILRGRQINTGTTAAAAVIGYWR